MSIEGEVFRIADQEVNGYKLVITGNLLAEDAGSLRKFIENCLKSQFTQLYIDAKNIKEVDLTGINEIIHSSYTLKNAGKELTFVYRQNSEIEAWVEKTGLDKFMATAIISENS